MRSDDPRRFAEDQKRNRSDSNVPSLVPGRHLRIVFDEHQRNEHAGLHQPHRRELQQDAKDLSAAAYVCCQRSRAGYVQLLCTVHVDPAVAAEEVSAHSCI